MLEATEIDLRKNCRASRMQLIINDEIWRRTNIEKTVTLELERR